MKFLSKLAQVALKVGQVIGIFGPMIQTVVPASGAVVGRIMDSSQLISNIIFQVELGARNLATPLAGPDKLKLASPNVAQAILQSAALAGKKIKNETLFMQGAEKIAGGWADVWNAVDEDEVTKL